MDTIEIDKLNSKEKLKKLDAARVVAHDAARDALVVNDDAWETYSAAQDAYSTYYEACIDRDNTYDAYKKASAVCNSVK